MNERCPICGEHTVEPHIKAWEGGFAPEVAYICTTCGIVGWWAYGSYDPNMPFGNV